MTSPHSRVLRSFTLLLAAMQPLACYGQPDNQSADAGKARADESIPLDAETQMRAGLDALSTSNDLEAAAAAFRAVLEQDPTHYGATYQLASALDQLQMPAEAEPLWRKVLVMADGYQDTATADTARARLGESQTADSRMKAGLDAFYARDDPTAAAAMFRAVLEQDPTHYGATYQLAAALDAAGNRDEARTYWEQMLPMADAVNDQATIDTARARLADTP